VQVVNYGASNLRSVVNALRRLGAAQEVVEEGSALRPDAKVILPGVGAASSAMAALSERGFVERLRGHARPVLGICLGLQLLLERSEEDGDTACLGIVSGAVRRFEKGVKTPHIGWNQVRWRNTDPLSEGISQDGNFYFVHSYVARPPADAALGESDYGGLFCTALRKGHIWGVQFHPEKSGASGFRLLRNFIERC
jgi:imidazole glycerol phosphate synthase glutamine amidotransferase subunit